MDYTDPQIVSIILILPAIFGLTLFIEGFQKVRKGGTGWFNLVVGAVFVIIVSFAYIYLRL